VRALFERPRRSIGLILASVAWLFFAGCDHRSSVISTDPKNGAEDVDTETKVLIRFSDTFFESDTTDSTTLGNSVEVRGTVGGHYTGTVVLKSFADARDDLSGDSESDDDESEDDVRAGQNGGTTPTVGGNGTQGANSGNNPQGGSTTGGGNGNTSTGEESPEDGGGSTGPQDTGLDTLVFSLPSGTQFRPGERVSVSVSGLRIGGLPIDSHHFSFTIRIFEDSVPSSEVLRVLSTTPERDDVGAAVQPRIAATFSRAVDAASLKDNVVVRGDASGKHALESFVFPRQESEGKVLEAVTRVDRDGSLRPGEWVTVTLNSEIKAASAGTTPGTGTASATKLLPYSYRFQVVPGLIGDIQAGWRSGFDFRVESSAPKLAVGDIRPLVDGLEVVVLNGDSLELYSQESPGSWRRSAERRFEDGSRPVDVKAGDLDGDGSSEILILLAGAEGSKIVTLIAGLSGALLEKDQTLELPATDVAGMSLADLDSNGQLDVVVRHPNRTYTHRPASGSPSTRQTGTLTAFEKSLRIPDPTTINPLDPSSLLPKLSFARIDNVLSRAAVPEALQLVPRSVEFPDLDGDGKLDMVLDTDNGLVLLRNLGVSTEDASQPFSYRFVRVLKTASLNENFVPATWTVQDLDGDLDADFLVLDAAGAFLYRNDLDPRRSTDRPEDRNPRGFFVRDPIPVQIQVTTSDGTDLSGELEGALRPWLGDLDGDGSLEAAIPRSDRVLSVFRVVPEDPVRLELRTTMETSIAGRLSSQAIADVDGDTGLDFLVASDSSEGSNVEFVVSQGVTPPRPALSSAFWIDLDQSFTTESEVTVVVRGDIEDAFSGYRVTLDFDETLLSFQSFQEPVNYSGLATFRVCGEAEGCKGFLSVDMSFQDTRGSRGDGIALGTLRFSKKTVQAATRTEVFLANGLAMSDGAERGNTLSVKDGSATIASEVRVDGDALVVPLAPPPRSLLEIAECRVREVEGTEYSAVLRWSVAPDVLYGSFEIQVNGTAVARLDRSALSYGENGELTFLGSDPRTLRVRGLGLAGDVIASAECQVAGVFQPQVNCSFDSLTARVVITWAIPGVVNGFRIYRNGALIDTLSAAARSYFDLAPSSTGADYYEVAGILTINGAMQEGARGACEEGAIKDPNPNVTEAPRSLSLDLAPRPLPASPNVLRLRWVNGEGYEAVDVKVWQEGNPNPVQVRSFASPAIEWSFEGDPDAGGVQPHRYRFSVQGSINGKASLETFSFFVPVPVPSLNVALTCESLSGSDVRLSWQAPWRGYSSLSLTRRLDGQPVGDPIPLPLDAMELVLEDLPANGDYDLVLAATYTKPLPASLVPAESSLMKSCRMQFRPVLRLETVETGVGLREVLIPIHGDLFGVVSGFRCAVEVPSVFAIDPGYRDQPEKLLRINDPNGRVIHLDAADAGNGYRRIEVEVTGMRASPGKNLPLASLVGSIAADFSLAGSYSLRFAGDAVQTYESGEEVAAAAVDAGAKMVVFKRFFAMESASATGGQTQPIILRVYATYDNPPPAEGDPPYGMVSYSLPLRWDPKLLDLQPITRVDQLETEMGRLLISEGNGGEFLFKEGAAFETARREGKILIGWVGFLPDPLNRVEIPSNFNLPILVLKFLPRVPELPGGALASIQLGQPDAAGDRTLLVPNWAPNDGPTLEAVFDGSVQIRAPAGFPRLTSITPARGPLSGGGEALLSGLSLLAGVQSPADLSIALVHREPGRSPVSRPVTRVIQSDDNLIKFELPSAGAEFYKPIFFSVPFDVELTTLKGRTILPEAYRYEYLRLLDLDVKSGSELGGERVEIQGYGIGPGARVSFRVEGSASGFEATVLDVADDGRKAVVHTPRMEGHAGKLATVEVVVPIADGGQSGVSELRDVLPSLYLLQSGPAEGALLGALPDRGPIEGGTVVRVQTSGLGVFAPADVQVFFADEEAVVLETFQSGDILTLSPRADAAGTVELRAIVKGKTVRRSNAFEYRDDEPQSPPVLSITGFSPQSGSICGELITVTGVGFTPETRFQMGGREVQGVEWVDGNHVRLRSPAVDESVRELRLTASGAGAAAAAPAPFLCQDVSFVRGDVDGDGKVNVSDSVRLNQSIAGTWAPPAGRTLDSLDVNDDGAVNALDLQAINAFLFQGSRSMPAPFPGPGLDPTPDSLTSCGR
jgi:hypothetical protein